MKLRLFSALIALSSSALFFAPTNANAEGFESYYISGTLGTNFTNTYGGTFAVGLDDPNLPLRLEVELQYRFRDKDSIFVDGAGLRNGDIHLLGPFANIFYDWENTSLITPFIGVGIGYVRIEQADRSDYKVAYQAMLGAAYEINETLDFYGAYRYVESRRPDLSGIQSDRFQKHIGEIGIRVNF